jgi:uncharacterized protein YkwD
MRVRAARPPAPTAPRRAAAGDSRLLLYAVTAVAMLAVAAAAWFGALYFAGQRSAPPQRDDRQAATDGRGKSGEQSASEVRPPREKGDEKRPEPKKDGPKQEAPRQDGEGPRQAADQRPANRQPQPEPKQDGPKKGEPRKDEPQTGPQKDGAPPPPPDPPDPLKRVQALAAQARGADPAAAKLALLELKRLQDDEDARVREVARAALKEAEPRPAEANEAPLTPQQQALARLTNDARKGAGLAALPIDRRLNAAAQKHAENLAKQDKNGDDGRNGHILDGKTYADRAKAEGYPNIVRENVGGYGVTNDPAVAINAVLRGWLASEGHRATLLLPTATALGVGIARSASGKWYLCQVFGSDQPAPAGLATVVNQSGAKVRLRLPDGQSALFNQNSTNSIFMREKGQEIEVEVMLDRDSAKATPFRLTDGATYLITADGKGGIRVEKK